MTRKISQREARRLRRRISELETRDIARQSRWSSEYPGGVHITLVDLSNAGITMARLETAVALGCALVARIDGQRLRVYGVLP